MSVAAVGGDEGGKVSVGRMEWNTVISVPAVHHRLDLVGRDGGDDGPGRLSVMCLSGGVFVEASVVNNTARGAVMFCRDHHPATPRDWSVDRNFLQNTQPDVSVEAVLDSLLPVERNLAGTVNGDRLGLLVNEDPERRGAVHQMERLVFTDIESAGLVPVQDVLTESGDILGSGSTGEDSRSLRRKFSPRTAAGV